MKSVVAPYQTAATCVRIECVNGTVIRITNYPFDLVMSNATVYKTDAGYEPSSHSATSSFSPSALDLEGIAEVGSLTNDQLASGVFDNARVFIFKCNYLSPVEDYEEVLSGFFGKTTKEDERYSAECISIVDALNQSFGYSYTTACSNTFCDSGCGITKALVQKTGTLSAVSSRFVVRDAARTEADDWFGGGTIEFSTGDNAGLKPLEIRSYLADGTITTFDPFYYTPAIGDAYILTPGCRKRLVDCRDKWGNVAVTSGTHALKSDPNSGGFFGFPDVPSSSTYQQVGGRS